MRAVADTREPDDFVAARRRGNNTHPDENNHQMARLPSTRSTGRGVGKYTSSLLCLFIISIPVGSIYLGYMLGKYLGPDTSYIPDSGVVVDTSLQDFNHYNTHNLTITFAGGFGNRMFQYASLYGIAKANGLIPVISGQEDYFLKVFPNLKAKRSTDTYSGYSRFREMRPLQFDTRAFSLNFMKNIRLEGFYQSWRYFDHVRSDIRKQFQFSPEIQSKSRSVVEDIWKHYGNREKDTGYAVQDYPTKLVGVHVRRGDMLEDYNKEKGYVVADPTYMRHTMSYFSERYKNVIFLVTTDDMEWSQKHAVSSTSPVVFSPFDHNDPALDLSLLSMCNHTIFTVGTFGWWGAWLAGGETLYYKNFPKPRSQIYNSFSASDHFVPQWVPV